MMQTSHLSRAIHLLSLPTPASFSFSPALRVTKTATATVAAEPDAEEHPLEHPAALLAACFLAKRAGVNVDEGARRNADGGRGKVRRNPTRVAPKK